MASSSLECRPRFRPLNEQGRALGSSIGRRSRTGGHRAGDQAHRHRRWYPTFRGDYFVNRQVEEKVERGGLEMTFWTYSLETTSGPCTPRGCGSLMTEPGPEVAPAKYGRWMRVTTFLMVRATKA